MIRVYSSGEMYSLTLKIMFEMVSSMVTISGFVHVTEGKFSLFFVLFLIKHVEDTSSRHVHFYLNIW